MPKKILILTPFYPPNLGGAESFTEGLVKEVSKWHDVTVLTFQPFTGRSKKYEKSYTTKGTLRIYRMNWLIKHSTAWVGTGLRNLLSVFPQMVNGAFLRLSKEKYDIIHAQGLISGLVAVLLKKVFKVKVYITLLALYEFEKQGKVFKWVARFVFDNCDRIFVEGKNGSKDIETIDIHAWKIKEFNHWVDQDIFCPPKERPTDKIRVLFVGRPTPEKGKHIIQEAERLLNDKEKYEFTYVENVPFQDLPKYYQMADVLVVPSLYAEGYVCVVSQGASCGCAIITSNRGSLPEMVKDFGIYIVPYAEEFREVLQELSDDDYLSIRQGAALIYAKENFSPKNAEVFLESYK